MAGSVWLVIHDVTPDSGWHAVAQLVVGGAVGVVVYVCVLLAVRSPELESIRRRLPAALRGG